MQTALKNGYQNSDKRNYCGVILMSYLNIFNGIVLPVLVCGISIV